MTALNPNTMTAAQIADHADAARIEDGLRRCRAAVKRARGGAGYRGWLRMQWKLEEALLLRQRADGSWAF